MQTDKLWESGDRRPIESRHPDDDSDARTAGQPEQHFIESAGRPCGHGAAAGAPTREAGRRGPEQGRGSGGWVLARRAVGARRAA